MMGRLRSLAVLAFAAALSACGGGGGGGGGSGGPPAAQNRIDVAVVGLPSGSNAAIAIMDAAGKTVGTLTATGQAFVAGAGKFSVGADPVIAAAVTYTATVAPGTLDLPAPPSVASVTVTYAPAGPLQLGFAEVASGLVSPTFLASPPGSTEIYVVEQPGRIRKLINGALQGPALDISARVGYGGERGMFSLAFDPQFAGNGNVFVYFTEPGGDIAVERFTFPVAGGTQPPGAPESTAVRVITISHTAFANHNGGQLQFGPDGMLYIGTGDGGGGGDPLGSGQNPGTLLGKILRVDVSSLPYKVPPDNPFVGQPGKRPEIWAYGLRNPWRFSFDSATRSLYIADVGQGSREEVNVVAASTGGLNYGWNLWEGSLCFASTAACDRSGITLPLVEYDHGSGCSITGGYVYRGSALPEVTGRYFYSDFCGGWLRSFLAAGGAATERVEWTIAAVGNIQSFGEDSRKELYALTSAGKVYRLVRQ